MKILQISNKAPFPPKDGGAIAILNMATGLSENEVEVTVLAMNTDKHKSGIEAIPSEYSSRINFMYVPVNTSIRLTALLRNLFFSSMPYNAERFISPEFSEALEKLLLSENYDVIQLEGLYLSFYIPLIRKFSKAIVSFRAHNVENEIWSRIYQQTRNPMKRAYYRILAKRIAQLEAGLLNQYDVLVPITHRDLLSFNTLGNKKPYKVTPVGIPDSYFKENIIISQNPDIFFIGSLDWRPNQDGLLWFVNNVWKELKIRRASLNFHVAGRNAPHWLIQKFHDNNVFFHGEVDDATSFFDNHQIMLVPLFAGSGMRVKIVEALARSKVIVTTAIGAEGINVTDKANIMIAETKKDFTQAIEILIDNSEFYKKLAGNAFAVAKQHYNNTTIATELLQFYNKVK
jgi:glycosyltransferase involved in cell wall biosynthesis